MKAPARRVSVIARERWERKGRLFCLSGNTSSPPNCPEFFCEQLPDLSVDHFTLH